MNANELAENTGICNKKIIQPTASCYILVSEWTDLLKMDKLILFHVFTDSLLCVSMFPHSLQLFSNIKSAAQTVKTHHIYYLIIKKPSSVRICMFWAYLSLLIRHRSSPNTWTMFFCCHRLCTEGQLFSHCGQSFPTLPARTEYSNPSCHNIYWGQSC